MSSDRRQNAHTIMDYLFVGPAGPAGRPIFVETPAGYYVKFHFFYQFLIKKIGWWGGAFQHMKLKCLKFRKIPFKCF